MSIILWDIPSTVGPWSPNTWKVRYCLNFKGIPYKTEWIEYPDIAPHCQKLGISHTTINSDGTPYYSLPAIYDPSTNKHIADSAKIVEYLETQYPSAPRTFPFSTMGLSIDFEEALDAKLAALWQFAIPVIHDILNPASQEYFRTTREKSFDKKLEDVVPNLESDEGKEEWKKVEEGFAGMAAWYSKNGGKGPFLLGERVSWPDIVVAAHLLWLKAAWGEHDRKWKDVLGWQGGVWKVLGEAMKEYEKKVD